jgi:anti-sigma factor RsiW
MVTGGAPCAQIRPELGVYLLGAIEPDRRPAVESHLTACDSCRAELSALAGLPSLLRRVPADTLRQLAADDPAQVMSEPPPNALLARMGAIRRRRNLLAAAAAVAAAIVAASAVQGLHDATAHPPAAVAPAAVAPARAVTVQGTNPETGTWAAVRYTAKPWGTELEVSITGVTAGTRCQLLVTGPQGQVIKAGGWDYAVGSQPEWYPASVPIAAASLQRFTIVADGKTLVTIQAR